MRSVWNFQGAGQLVFGPGAITGLGRLLSKRHWLRVLVVTDKNLVEAGVVDHVLNPLAEAKLSVELFDGGQPEPPIETAEEAAARAREFSPDVIVGVGGGSNIDLAKIVAAVFTHGGSPRDYFGFDKIPGPVTPLVCAPTTAGTGSEVSHAAVLTDRANKIKVSTLSQFLRPALAVVDPELTYGCPERVTADSGIDALTHAIEAYTAVDYHELTAAPGEGLAYEGRFPLGEQLAAQAIELIGRHLVAAVREGANVAARDGMALAATLAGMAFSNCGVAVVHALEYPLGGMVHCSHGAGNGLLLPHVMRFNLPERQEALARVAALLGESTEGLETRQAAERALVAVERLRDDIGVPARLRQLGATAELLPLIAEKALAIPRLMEINPRRPTYDDLLAILREAF